MKTILIDDLRDIKADVVCRTYDDSIRALKESGPFDILFLDHDLADTSVPERTGYDIMCFLEEHPEYLPKSIQIVSSNTVGRQNIRRVIDSLKRRGLFDEKG